MQNFRPSTGMWRGLVCLENDLKSGHRRRARDGTLRLESIPNPYPMPHTPYNIQFDEDPGEPLPQVDARTCLILVRQQLLRYIRVHGGDHDLEPCEFRYESVSFGVVPFAGQITGRHLTYFDMNAIIAAFSLKMSSDGYRTLRGRIFMTVNGQEVGTALIDPVPDIFANASS